MPILWRSSDFSSSVKEEVWAERVSAVKNSTQIKISFFIISMFESPCGEKSNKSSQIY